MASYIGDKAEASAAKLVRLLRGSSIAAGSRAAGKRRAPTHLPPPRLLAFTAALLTADRHSPWPPTLLQREFEKRADPNDRNAQALLDEMRQHIKKVHAPAAAPLPPTCSRRSPPIPAPFT